MTQYFVHPRIQIIIIHLSYLITYAYIYLSLPIFYFYLILFLSYLIVIYLSQLMYFIAMLTQYLHSVILFGMTLSLTVD